jgi:hypothetical protein
MAGKPSAARRSSDTSASVRLSGKLPPQKGAAPPKPPQKPTPQNAKKSLPSLKPRPKPILRPVFVGDEQKLCTLVTRALEIDPTSVEARLLLLRSTSSFLSQYKLSISPEIAALLFNLCSSIFLSALPFTIVQKGYRQFYFKQCDLPEDVNIGYELFLQAIATNPEVPDLLLRALVRRLSSASIDDRTHAKGCILSLSVRYYSSVLHFMALLLSPAPPHGADVVLECIAHMLDNSMFYDADLWLQLEIVLHHLHLAPHLKTFHSNLIVALKSLHEKDSDIAHHSRRFLLNNWPRLDPQRAVLFMQEALAICLHGPPIQEDVWQRLSWRSSSIQWQIASEGLSFVQQTIELMGDVDDSILRFLLEDAVQKHWSVVVKERAKEVLPLLPPVPPAAPKVLQIDAWNRIREMARSNDPKIEFAKRK